VAYDPTTYLGAAPYYAQGRPPYSAELVASLEREVGLGRHSRLLDVGCGPGILTIELAPHVDEAIGLDPDPGMLTEAAKRAHQHDLTNITWVQALAEDIPTLQLGAFSVVTFGQSFHRTDRERVAEAVWDLLEPGGAIVLIAPEVADRPRPAGPGHPPIPGEDIEQLVDSYLGPRRRSGKGFVPPPVDRFEDALARTRFGSSRSVFAPGRPDIVQDIDGVVALYYSSSWAAPHLFGERRTAFEAELRALLRAHSPAGLFWNWPGDTAIVIGTKPA
jgi:SAM-dependent methyltransferase